jgi:transcriptional regulator
MYYGVGSRIRVKLYSGEEVEAIVTAVMDQSSGKKVQIRFGGVTILVSPEQIIEVLR